MIKIAVFIPAHNLNHLIKNSIQRLDSLYKSNNCNCCFFIIDSSNIPSSFEEFSDLIDIRYCYKPGLTYYEKLSYMSDLIKDASDIDLVLATPDDDIFYPSAELACQCIWIKSSSITATIFPQDIYFLHRMHLLLIALSCKKSGLTYTYISSWLNGRNSLV